MVFESLKVRITRPIGTSFVINTVQAIATLSTYHSNIAERPSTTRWSHLFTHIPAAIGNILHYYLVLGLWQIYCTIILYWDCGRYIALLSCTGTLADILHYYFVLGLWQIYCTIILYWDSGRYISISIIKEQIGL